MKKFALFTALALALVPTAGIAFTATSASAVVDQSSAEQLVRASLAQMGVTNPDAALVASMVTELLAQQDAGTIIDTTLIDPAPTVTQEPTPTDTAVPTSAPTPAETEGPHHLMGRHYKEQSALWALASPVWNSAFDTIRTAYDECVTAAVAGVDCAATLIPDLQVAHAAALAGAYDQIVAQIAAMPADQQAAAQAALDLQNASAQKQLAHVLAEHTPTDATTGLVNTSVAQLNELQAELERKSAWYRTNNPTGTPVDPAAGHRQDAEHRSPKSVHTATPEPTSSVAADPAAGVAPSATPQTGTQRNDDDFAKRLRQSNRR